MTSTGEQQGQTKSGLRAFKVIVVMAMVVASAGAIALAGVLDGQPDPSALASTCTVTVDAGDVEALADGSDNWGRIESGVTLQAGTRVRTTANSVAMLTFFNGSTLKLEPDTDVLVEQIECSDSGHTVVAIRQWIGTTWSRVVEMANPASRYEIRTPTAMGLVRGTYFMVRVDEAGSTTIKVIEGEVTVLGQVEDTQDSEDLPYDEERGVAVPAGYQVDVEPESPPSHPQEIPADDSRQDTEEGADDIPNASPTPAFATPTPEFTCSAYVTFRGDPGEYALVDVTAGPGSATARLGEVVTAHYQLQYIGPLGPILARPVVLVTDPDSRIVRTWAIAEDGSLNPNRDSTEPYPISVGSRFSVRLIWDLTDGLGQDVSAAVYRMRATIEVPLADGSGQFHALDSVTPDCIDVVVGE